MENRMRRKKRFCALFLLTALLLTACGSGGSAGTGGETSVAQDTQRAVTEESIVEGDGELDGADVPYADPEEAESASHGRKLIKTVDMDVETTEFDALTGEIERRVESLGGYVESSGIYFNGGYSDGEKRRNADYTVRVPSGRLPDFVEKVEEDGSVVRKNVSVQDLTLNYVDIESRKKALEIEQERLMELLKEAGSVDAVISIEERLSDIRYEIQNFGSQLRMMDNQVDYGTVNIHIKEVRSIAARQEEGTFSRIAAGFSNSVGNVLIGVRELFVGFMILLPYLLCIAVFGLIVYLIARVILGHGGKAGEKKSRSGARKQKGVPVQTGAESHPGQDSARKQKGMPVQGGARDPEDLQGKR